MEGVATNLLYRATLTVPITIFYINCLLWGSGAWSWWRFKRSIKMCGRFRNKITLVKFTYPGKRPKILSLSLSILWEETKSMLNLIPVTLGNFQIKFKTERKERSKRAQRFKLIIMKLRTLSKLPTSFVVTFQASS